MITDRKESAEYLRVISRVGVGWDNVDHKTAKSIGIKVYRTPDATTETVAELTLGLILSLLRKINQMDHELKSGLWNSRMNMGSGRLLITRTKTPTPASIRPEAFPK